MASATVVPGGGGSGGGGGSAGIQGPRMGSLPAVKRQHLLAEFAGLKQACPDGVFVSLTPGDPSLWSGVIFVRKGPYAPAVLRFQISFPDSYPSLPPLVTFATDMFHPLITPLTTYMYTTDIHDAGTVSATDEERLPPGGFSLRHGFPGWFGRGARKASSGRQVGGGTTVTTPPRATAGSIGAAGAVIGEASTPGSAASPALSATPGFAQTKLGRGRNVSTYEVLRYIRSTFDDEDVLDSVSLEAAGNPGAWHAWKTHRRQEEGPTASGATPRRPGEWNWEGVWEERVKRGISTSLSDAVLYGNAGGADEVINFVSMEEAEIEVARRNLLQTLGART